MNGAQYCRRLGNGLWSIKNRVVIFKNDEFLGDFNDLNEFIWKKWKYVLNEDWYKLASDHLIEYLESKTEQCVSKICFLYSKSFILIQKISKRFENEII